MPDAQPATADEPVVLSMVPTNPDDCYFMEVYLKGFEATVNRCNDTLNRLVTLGTGLTGGALVLLKDDVCYGWWRVAAACMFFLALAAAVVGAVPVYRDVEPNGRAVRDTLVDVANVKGRWIWAAVGLILAGLLSAIVGVGVRVYHAG